MCIQYQESKLPIAAVSRNDFKATMSCNVLEKQISVSQEVARHSVTEKAKRCRSRTHRHYSFQNGWQHGRRKPGPDNNDTVRNSYPPPRAVVWRRKADLEENLYEMFSGISQSINLVPFYICIAVASNKNLCPSKSKETFSKTEIKILRVENGLFHRLI